MTREDRLRTHIKLGRLGIEPSKNVDSEKNGEHFDMVMWDEKEEYCWVIATITKDAEGNPYLQSVGEDVLNINPDEFYSVMKLLFELEKM